MTRIFIIFSIVLGAWFFWVGQAVASVQVVWPNGGECLTVGVQYKTIEVDFHDAHSEDHVAIYYRTDGTQPAHLENPVLKHPLMVSIWTSPGWTPDSGDITETGRIWAQGHLTNHTSTGNWDDSDADFAVRADCGGGGNGGIVSGGGTIAYRPEITITSPKEKDAFGNIVEIVYKATDENDSIEGQTRLGLGNNPVSIFYAEAQDIFSIRKKKLIVKDMPALGSYKWDVADIPAGDTYMIVIEAVDNSSERGQAISGPFSIDHTIPVASVYSEGAIISWKTLERKFSFVEYGVTSTSYTTQSDFYPALSTDHYAVLSGLEASTTYYFRMVTGRPFVEKERSDEFSFTTLPPGDTTRPWSVTGEFGVPGASTTLLAWTNPPAPYFSDIGINRRDDQFPRHPKDGITMFRSTEPYFRDGALINGTTYYYSIFSFGGLDDYSLPIMVALTPQEDLPEALFSPAEEVRATTTLPRIRFPSSDASENEITLSWKNPDDPNFLGIHIVRNDESLPGNPFDGKTIFRGREQSFIDSGLEAGKRFFYGLFAFNWDNIFSPAAFITDETLVSPVAITTEVSIIAATTTPAVATTTEGIIDTVQAQFIVIQNKIAELKQKIQNLFADVEDIRKTAIRERLGIKGKIHIVGVKPDGFYPKIITISSGDTIVWVNNTRGFYTWPASNVHDTHFLYPEYGGCINSLFDACRSVGLGEDYSFTFTRIGAFGFHDHLHPTNTGKIIIE